VYYGRENLIVADNNNSFWLVDFLLPMYYISNSSQPNNQTLYINCTYTQYELFYNIFWSDIEYPSYLIQETNTSTQVSYQNINIENLNDYYLIIGPAFEVFMEATAGLDINVLNISKMLGIDGILNVVDIIFISKDRQKVPY
jgi:hypothetical protein